MMAGFLCLHVAPDHPGIVRVVVSDAAPEGLPAPADGSLVYVARFRDVDAARMHAHESLRRGLVDVEQRLYRADVVQAVAAVEADDLGHQRVWIEPSLVHDQGRQIAALKKSILRRRERRDRVWRTVGALGILLLAFKLLGVI